MTQTFTERNLKSRKAVWVKEKIFPDFGVFQIWEFPEKAWGFPNKLNGVWRSFYLRIKHPSTNVRIKRAWWFGWNGERVSKTRDMKLLIEHKPEVYKWVRGVLYDC